MIFLFVHNAKLGPRLRNKNPFKGAQVGLGPSLYKAGVVLSHANDSSPLYGHQKDGEHGVQRGDLRSV